MLGLLVKGKTEKAFHGGKKVSGSLSYFKLWKLKKTDTNANVSYP